MRKDNKFDFSGWATKNDLRCKDGRTIRKDAFKDDDGRTVPLVWMHQHNDPSNVLGHALLENRDEGVYAYCSFNDSFSGKQAKEIVCHGDVCSLSIWANELKQNGGDVMHGSIKEVSVVLAGANPGAIIDYPTLSHGEESMEEAYIRVDEPIELSSVLSHAEETEEETNETEEPENEELTHAESEEGSDPTVQEVYENMDEKKRATVEYLVGLALEQGAQHSDDEVEDVLEHAEDDSEEDGETIQDVLDSMTEEERAVTEYLIGQALESKETTEQPASEEVEHSDDEGEEETMKSNVFDVYGNGAKTNENTLSHADGMKIVEMAKANGGTSLKAAMEMYIRDNNKELKHADGDDDLNFAQIDQLFPEYALRNGPEPEMLTLDTGWVSQVMRKTSKSPKSRLRVRFADARDLAGRRAQGYTKGTQKAFMGNMRLLGRTVDPTTVYNLDKMNRDDVLDITDFNLVNYMYKSQRANLEEELARAILIGDGRNGGQDDDGQEIDKTKIIPIWGDDELFTIHTTIDPEAMRTEMNGSDSDKHFGDNYVWSEAVIQSLLYAREGYKGSGAVDFYCTPHLVNVMLLARDLNGRRIYDNVNELKAAMNVNDIVTVEQFANKTRTVTVEGVEETRRLLGIMVNLKDYVVGSVSGGQITHFTDFDIRFNQNLSLLETRLCGMLERPFSAIVLEEVVTDSSENDSEPEVIGG